MEDNPYSALAMFMGGGGAMDGLLLGTVASWPTQQQPDKPHKVYLDGNTQEGDDLLRSGEMTPYDLAEGDTVLAAPIEERQRYILICKVVAL